MIIKLSNGELTLKKLTRKLKKELKKEALKDVGFDLQSQKLDKLMAPVIEDFNETALKILAEKIVIEGKEYPGTEIERLNDEGMFTDEDWEVCEQAAGELFVNEALKKKQTTSEQSSLTSSPQ